MLINLSTSYAVPNNDSFNLLVLCICMLNGELNGLRVYNDEQPGWYRARIDKCLLNGSYKLVQLYNAPINV